MRLDKWLDWAGPQRRGMLPAMYGFYNRAALHERWTIRLGVG